MAATSTLVMAELSYPMSEVRGSSQECQAAMAQERPRGATPSPRLRGTVERSHPEPEARGGSQEEPHHVQGAEPEWAQEGLEELSQEGWW